MGEKLTLIGGTYDYEYADNEEKWEWVKFVATPMSASEMTIKEMGEKE